MRSRTWLVHRDRFPLEGPGVQLGFVDAPDRAEATRAAVAKYGARVIVVKATKADILTDTAGRPAGA